MKMTQTPNSTRFGFLGETILIALIGLAAAAHAIAAAPGARTVTLTDYLGVDWKDELVHYAVELPKGALKGAAVAQVRAADGKSVPCQASDVVKHDDGSIRSFNVWFVTDLPSNQSASFTITPGQRGPEDVGVAVKATEASIELTTKAPQKIGIRLLGGAKECNPPVPATGVRGPIAALLLPSGRETGHGRFQVPFHVKSWKAEVTAAGPVFAEARIQYAFDTGTWTFTARVVRGCPMVLVHEELDTGHSGQDWDKADRFYSFTLNGGGFKPAQAWYTGRTDAESYHDLMNQYVQPVLKGGLDRGVGVPVNGFSLTFKEDRTDYYLTAWPTWSPRAGVAVRFVEPSQDAVGFAAVKTMDWKNPMALRFCTAANGDLAVNLPLQMYRQGWPSEGFGYRSPNYTGKTLGVPETTARRSYGIMLTTAEDEQQAHMDSLLHRTARLGSQPLDEVKDWVLDWPDPMEKAAWAAETGKAGQGALATLRRWLAAKRALGDFASYSMWTYYDFSLVRYPAVAAVLDKPAELSAADRRTLRRLCAFQAYVLNSLGEFPWGAGPHLGNPNMSMMAMEARAKSAALVKDHPMCREWGAWTLTFIKDYIERYTRETGAPYEDPQYTLGVTLKHIGEISEILREAGVGDVLDVPRFKACMRLLLDWSLPPDPRFLGHRQMLAYGNGSSYLSVPPDFASCMVQSYTERDPHLAAQFQWVANQSLPEDKQLRLVADEAPRLGSVHHKDYGVIFRHGYGTPFETFFFLMAGNCDGHYEGESDQMTYTLHAKGQPIHLHFGNGYQPMFIRPWLRNRVSFDHMVEESERNPTTVRVAAFTPEAEYARAARGVDSLRPLKTEYPVTTNNGTAWASDEQASWPQVPQWQRIPMTTWDRQVLFLKDADPKGPNYFVLRDTFGGRPTRPTDLSLWFLANKMDRNGNVFHFDGQCKVDMDVFVASPTAVEPETGKYGHPQHPYGRLVGFDPKFFPDGKLSETQLFLRLKQPAGKGYMVVLYPRLKESDPAATFASLADGVVRVETPLSTDYAFLNPDAFEFKDERVQFSGLSGTVRFYKSGKIAIANAEGKAEVRVAGRRIEGTGPFTATIEGGKVNTQTHGTDARVDAK